MEQTLDKNEGLLKRFRKIVRRHSARIAVRAPGAAGAAQVEFTYGMLNAWSDELAVQLIAAGVKPQDSIAVLAEQSPGTIAALLAIVKVNAVYVPISCEFPAERIRFILEDNSISLALLPRENTTLPGDGFAGIRCLEVQDYGRSERKGQDIGDRPDDCLYVMYTSGSTGRPKGVRIAHRGVLRLVDESNTYARFDSTRVFLQLAPLTFDASTFEIWGALLNGGTCVIYPHAGLPEPALLADILRKEKVTTLWLTATLFNWLVDNDALTQLPLEELLIGGEVLSLPHVRKAQKALPSTQLVNGYGPTETTAFAVCYRIPKPLPAEWRSVPIGVPIAKTEAYVLDGAQRKVPNDCRGELYLAGDGLALDYRNLPALTAEKFTVIEVSGRKVRCYATGDFVTQDETGVFHFEGRVDDQVKISGHRIELGEINYHLKSHPAVSDACTLVRQHARNRQPVLISYLVTAGEVQRQNLRQFLLARMPAYMVPSVFEFLEKLPVNGNGKLDRQALQFSEYLMTGMKSAEAIQQAITEPGVTPLAAVETRLAGLWCDTLELSRANDEDSFFDCGGTSLAYMAMVTRGKQELGLPLQALDIFEHPTLGELKSTVAQRLQKGKQTSVSNSPAPHENRAAPVAIIGMAGRFPGAHTVEQLWDNLCKGVDSITYFDPEALAPSEQSQARTDADYVPARGVINDVDKFDAAFFGIGAKEAEASDPQQRIFLEECWAALESAGYYPADDNRIGLFAGVGHNGYYQQHVFPRYGREGPLGELPTQFVNDKDYIATRTSYKLNLQGPSLSINTACSTSLVAVVEAVKSLRAGDCDLALGGGVSLQTPMNSGYLYQEGGMLSKDGKTRPFDQESSGTTFNSGVAVVVLKRLDDAQRDGDAIHAVIRGVGVNNDGAQKASFTAPSVRGQAEVIERAIRDAGVEPESIRYVETHGTATPLGDPIEVEALNRAFNNVSTRGLKSHSCAIGAVKSNVGHLVAAAGATGLIKASLALKHRSIPGTLHYKSPNRHIDFSATPFYVAAKSTNMRRQNDSPLRAGVSSFGVGGTNAHVILEEAPAPEERVVDTRPQLFTVSAKTNSALNAYLKKMALALKDLNTDSFADAAYTTQVSRSKLGCRAFVVASTAEEASKRLADGAGRADSGVGGRTANRTAGREVVFVFSGQGSQCVNMGRHLYASQPVYRENFDRCAELFGPHLERDLKTLLFCSDTGTTAQGELSQTRYTQPALFALEYALAQQWLALGIQPKALIGHSIGEFAAAAVSGVFSLPDAVRVVAARGRLMQEMASGSMLAVRAGTEKLAAMLGADTEVAAINAPEMTVVSGTASAVDTFAQRCSNRDIKISRLHTSQAFHSRLMDPAVGQLEKELEKISLHPPSIPIVSTVTGHSISDAEATSPRYWATQLRLPVKFSDAVQNFQGSTDVLLEVGPREALTSLIVANVGASSSVMAVASGLDGAADEYSRWLHAVGKLWQGGVVINWDALHAGNSPRRVGLPSYPFQRQRYWIDSLPAVDGLAGSRARSAEASAGHESEGDAPEYSSGTGTEEVMTEKEPLQRLKSELAGLFEERSGEIITVDSFDTEFIALGFDSLFLTQAVSGIRSRFGVKLPFRRLMQDLSTIAALAEFLAAEVDMSEFSQAPMDAGQGGKAVPVARRVNGDNEAAFGAASNSALASVMAQQLQIIQQQLNLLSGSRGSAAATPRTGKGLASDPRALAERSEDRTTGKEDLKTDKCFGAQTRIETSLQSRSDLKKRESYRNFFAEYVRATKKSQEYTQRYRQHLSDPRAVSGFRPEFKEIVYPIVTERSEGCTLWDLDGNKYIDLTSGYGSNFFGYSAPFVVHAMQKQIQRGIEIGPQHALAGPLAEKICRCVGMDRVAFCNTGSEAVMGAIRIARTVTARKLIVTFTGAYHGIFDEVVVRGSKKLRTVPAAAGIEAEAVQNVLVLNWNDPESLQIIRDRSEEIAAVMVEPVQSRNPDCQPVEFLKSLRKITEQGGSALVFDEIVTGFRIAPGGAQDYFGIRADLAVYGKVLGGGISIGVIAGAAEFMGALDGGFWQYGDDSKPQMGVTYFAGTFVRHPLALAAANAVVDFIEQQSASFYPAINTKGKDFATRLNGIFERLNAPLHVEQFCTVLYICAREDNPDIELLYADMRLNGVHVWSGRPMFLTLCHQEDELDQVLEQFEKSVLKMQRLGFLAGLTSRQREFLPPSPGARLGRDEQGRAGWYVLSSNAEEQFEKISPGSESEVCAQGSLVNYDPFRDGELECAVESTEAQRELWLAAQMGNGPNCSFNESVSLHLHGDLDRRELIGALRGLLNRHDALRSCFSQDGKQLVFLKQAQLVLDKVDLSGESEAKAEESFRRICTQAVLTPFDLSSEPLARFQLLKFSQVRHILVLTFHHTVCDGWSMYVVAQDLGRLYSSRCGNETLSAAASFVDYAKWDRSPETEEQRAASLDYWKQKLSDSAPFLEFPLDKPRPPLKTYRAKRVDKMGDADLVPGAMKLASAQRVTLNSVLLAGFCAFAFRLTGRSEVLFGVPFAGQLAKGDMDLVGHCVNVLPFKLDISGEETFEQLLAQVQAAMLEASDYQYVTLGTLLQSLKFQRDPSRSSLLSTLFNVDVSDEGLWAYQGLEVAMTSNPRCRENFDMNWNVTVSGGRATFECTFNTDLWHNDTIVNRLEELNTFLQASLRSADRPIKTLDIIPSSEELRLTEAGSGPSARREAANLIQLFKLKRHAGRIAVTCKQESLDFVELDRRSNRLANHLLSLGVNHNDFLGVYLERSTDMLVALLATWKAGAAYVPLDPAYPVDRLRYMAEAARLKGLITQSDLAPTFANYDWLQICLDDDAEAIAQESDLASNPQSGTHAEDPAYVIFTSGSTGKPKGVQVPHRAVINFLCSMAERPGLQPDDRLLAVTTLSFDIAVLELFLPLLVGAEVIIADRDTPLDGKQLLSMVRENDVNVMQATPSTWRLMLAAGWQGATDFKVLCGGEAFPVDLAQQLTRCVGEVWNMYGPTECTVWSCCYRLKENDGSFAEPIPIGAPIANTQCYVLDECHKLVPVGVPGELFVGGEGLASGYLHQPDLTAERFFSSSLAGGGRLYRTGDQAKWRLDGSLECLGRVDSQIKLRGFRIELGEIESILASHPKVVECAATVKYYSDADQRLVAYARIAEGEALNSTGMRRYLRGFLPDYMIPQLFVQVDALPLTLNGKIDRKNLPDPMKSFAESTQTERPRSDTEKDLADIWSRLLKKEQESVSEMFFDVGGHSLLALDMIAKIQERFQVDISPLDVLVNTLEQIAAKIEHEHASRTADEGSEGTAPVDPTPELDGALPVKGKLGIIRRFLRRQGQ